MTAGVSSLAVSNSGSSRLETVPVAVMRVGAAASSTLTSVESTVPTIGAVVSAIAAVVVAVPSSIVPPRSPTVPSVVAVSGSVVLVVAGAVSGVRLRLSVVMVRAPSNAPVVSVRRSPIV